MRRHPTKGEADTTNMRASLASFGLPARLRLVVATGGAPVLSSWTGGSSSKTNETCKASKSHAKWSVH